MGLFIALSSNAQQVRITWPVEGALIQQSENGNANVQFAGQLGYEWQNYSNYSIFITTLEGDNCPGSCSVYTIPSLDYSSNWNPLSTNFKSFRGSINLPKGWYTATVAAVIQIGSFGFPVPLYKIRFFRSINVSRRHEGDVDGIGLCVCKWFFLPKIANNHYVKLRTTIT